MNAGVQENPAEDVRLTPVLPVHHIWTIDLFLNVSTDQGFGSF